MKLSNAREALIIAGPQGSGKGTQAKHLTKQYGYEHFEMGGKLREIAQEPTPLGQEVLRAQMAGEFVAFPVVMRIVEGYLESRKAAQRLLFDGIPRDITQEQALMEKLDQAGRSDNTRMVLMDISEEDTMKNILYRGFADDRKDDQDPSTVAKRLQGFYGKTMPVVDKFDRFGRLIRVDAKPSIDMDAAVKVVQRIHQIEKPEKDRKEALRLALQQQKANGVQVLRSIDLKRATELDMEIKKNVQHKGDPRELAKLIVEQENIAMLLMQSINLDQAADVAESMKTLQKPIELQPDERVELDELLDQKKEIDFLQQQSIRTVSERLDGKLQELHAA